MNPYRCLSDEELNLLEDEFKAFLIVNNLFSEDWLNLNREDPAKAREVVELFSKTVFDQIISNSNYLILNSPKLIHLVKKENETLTAIWIKLKPCHVDDITNMTEKDWNHDNLECYTGTKTTKNINLEWFELMELGYQKTEIETWNHYLNFISSSSFKH
ncbi:MAG: hypothetical protein FJX99_00270 [Bacteroidetes bacterium]|nr:hypothetical protein [Bacteroidota bacterium]